MTYVHIYQNCKHPAKQPVSLLGKLRHAVKRWVVKRETAYAVDQLDVRLRRDIGTVPETEEHEYYSSYLWWRPFKTRFRETER